MAQRKSGVLAHITMLPSEYGIGDIGPAAYEFADYLVNSGQTIWQILPTHPIEAAGGNNPYSSESVFAGNPLLISPDLLIEDGLLCRSECEIVPQKNKIDYQRVRETKTKMLDKAFSRFKYTDDFQNFTDSQKPWLLYHALFKTNQNSSGGQSWRDWPQDFHKEPTYTLEHLFKEQFVQYEFFKQWRKLKDHCNSKGLKLFGDLPIYVNYESADVWSHQELFNLDPVTKKPLTVSGAPPDWFSGVGQKWYHPTYLWDKHKETGFAWWMERIEHMLGMVDILRIDHFLGLIAYWEIPEASPATEGHWVQCPHEEFFNTLSGRIDMGRLVAEDLGQVSDEVRGVMAKYNIPGMKVLQFGFGPDLPRNPHIPHNHTHNAVAYSGTHDNNTSRGWFDELPTEDKFRLFEYYNDDITSEEISWHMIDQAMRSVADTSILAVQDLLGLGSEARVNNPATGESPFDWKLVPNQLNFCLSYKLKKMAKKFGRA